LGKETVAIGNGGGNCWVRGRWLLIKEAVALLEFPGLLFYQ